MRVLKHLSGKGFRAIIGKEGDVIEISPGDSFLEEVVSKLRQDQMNGREAGRGEVQVQNCIDGA